MGLGDIPVPDALRDTFDAWQTRGRPQQPPIGWPLRTWNATLREHADLFQHLPNPIGREQASQHCADAAADHDHAIRRFLAAMVWGYGRNGGTGRTAPSVF